MSDANRDAVAQSSPKRKPIWPWLAMLAVTLMAIYAYNEALEMIDGLGRTGATSFSSSSGFYRLSRDNVLGTPAVKRLKSPVGQSGEFFNSIGAKQSC